MTNALHLTGMTFATAALLQSCAGPPSVVEPPARVATDTIAAPPPAIPTEPAKTQGDPAPPLVLNPFDGIVVLPNGAAVEIAAWTCLEAGWLEQIACAPNSREHESLVVVKAKPSEVHAALLLAGFEPGSPGTWSYVDDALQFTQPTGDRLNVLVRYDNAVGVSPP